MEFRKGTPSDLDGIMGIVSQAQLYFRENNIPQWEGDYPSQTEFASDMASNHCYVAMKNGHVAGMMAICIGNEPTYANIYGGEWLSNRPYAAIHRMAIHNEYKGSGLAADMLVRAEAVCKAGLLTSIRVDTHELNIAMRGLLIKNGFTYCGIIYLEDGSERMAFEKLLD